MFVPPKKMYADQLHNEVFSFLTPVLSQVDPVRDVSDLHMDSTAGFEMCVHGNTWIGPRIQSALIM